MGKITVRHFLNVNLKPYLIRGEAYYSMYIMVIVNRKSTKIKSITFGELYSEKDFEDIIEYDDKQMKQEATAIENICSLILDIFPEFDATLFSLYYSVLKDIFIDEIEWEEGAYHNFNLFSAEKNKLGIAMECFIYGDYSLAINDTHGMDLFNWYTEETQNELKTFLEQYSCVDHDLQKIMNKLAFLGSFKRFVTLIKRTRKGKELYDKYSRTFDDKFELYYEELQDIFG